MSDSRSGHDLGRGVAANASLTLTEPQLDDERVAEVGNPNGEGTAQSGRQQGQQETEDRGRAQAEARNAAGRGLPSGAFAGTAQPAVVQEAGEPSVSEQNEPFAWAGTWDEAAAERDRLRSAGEDTSDIQAWLNANEPGERREERLNTQKSADEIEPTENEDPADTQIAQELLGDLPGDSEDEGEGEGGGEGGEPPPESGLGTRLEDSIRRVLGMDGGKGAAAIGTLALVAHSLQEGLARGMQGEPVSIPSILEMALEDYRARRDRIDFADKDADRDAEMADRIGRIENELAENRQRGVGDIQNAQAIALHEAISNIDQGQRIEIMEMQQAFDLQLNDIDFDNEQQRMMLAQQMNIEMARIEQAIGLENFDTQMRETWEQTKREIQYMADNNGMVARAVNAQAGASSAQVTFNNVSSVFNTLSKAAAAFMP